MSLFVDTSAWLALNDKNDQYHKKAVVKSTKIKKERIELITSEYIINESITLIRYRVSHRAMEENFFGTIMQTQPYMGITIYIPYISLTNNEYI